MKRRILSLCLVLSMSIGIFPVMSSAENTDAETYVNSDDVIMNEQSENTGAEILTDFSNTPVLAENDVEIKNDEHNNVVPSANNVALYSGSAVMTLEQYDAQLAARANTLGKTDAAELVDDEEYVNILLRRRLVDKAGYDTLVAKMNEDADFAAAMEWLFSDIQMLRYYSYGGEPEANGLRQKYKVADSSTYMSSFDVLSQIYTKHKADMNDSTNAPLYKRMIAAIALTHSVRIYCWQNFTPYGRRYKWLHYSEPVGRYELYKKFHNFGFLADEFDEYNVEEMRMVMFAPIDNAQLE